ncbi:MAG TPA: D-glycerate dehydrogenase [Terriglobia bacterium]|nr:D-glycerate dehydrogenase [Terriglobia bacterium]
MSGKVYVTRPLLGEAADLLRQRTSVEGNEVDEVLPRAVLLDRLKTVDVAVTQLTDTIDADLLAALPQLKAVANVAVGFNNIDIDAATRMGVMITNTPGVLTETTADFAWTLLMAAARRVVEADRYVRAGKFKAWGLQMLLGQDIHGKTIGVVGFGRIGQAVARRARGFGMRVVFFDPFPVPAAVAAEAGAEAVSFDSLLGLSDFVSLHVPLGPDTHHLFNDAAFAKMKPTAVLVNTSRGPVIDEKALARALRAGRIAGAGLDVYEHEPAVAPELLTMDNIVLAPHIASASRETRLKMCLMAAENALAALDGRRPPNLVNPDVWERRRI